MYVLLCRYNFITKVINNGHMEVKSSLVWKKWMSCVPGRRMQIMGSVIPYFS